MDSPLIILRRDRLEYLTYLATEIGTDLSKRALACAAKLVDYFAHWGKWKKKTQRTGWVYQPLRQIRQDLMEEHGLYTIRRAIAFLLETKLLSRRRNPGNGQDKTWQYRIELPAFDTESPTFDIKPSKFETEQLHKNNIDSSLDITPSSGTADGVEMYGERGFSGSGESVSNAENAGEASKDKSEDIEPKPESGEGNSSAPATEESLETIEDLGIAINPQIKRAVKSATVEAVKNAIALTKSRRRNLNNPGGFLVRAIREGWQPDVVEPEVHPVTTASNSANPEELRSQFALIDEEKNSPEWQSGRAQFLETITKLKQRCLDR